MESIQKLCFKIFLIYALVFDIGSARYSEIEDAHNIAAYLRRIAKPTNHAKVARQLVHESDWSAVGSISTDKKVLSYPMVNIISVADSGKGKASTGKIYFLLTDLDFTGQDWNKENKVTFLFSKEQSGGCSSKSVDPMEPTCARVIISGKVAKMNVKSDDYQPALDAYISRHPSARKWIDVHDFYLCKLDIENIYVLDWYGGPKDVSVEDYYRANPDDN